MNYREIQFGFDWGAASITRCFSDEKKGWVTLLLETPKHSHAKGTTIQIYVTRTGKVRIHSGNGEWKKGGGE